MWWSHLVDNDMATTEDGWPCLLMRMWFGHIPSLFDQLDGLQTTIIKLQRDKSHDGIAENFRMLNLVHPGGSSGCCRWSDTCNWSLRVCCSCQLCILRFGSMNTHLMTLHKPTGIECLDSCPKLANSGGLSEAFIAPRLDSLLW